MNRMEMPTLGNSESPEEGVIQPEVDNSDEAIKQRAEMLMKKAFSLKHLALYGYKGGERVQLDFDNNYAHIPNGSYNMNNGVIMIKRMDNYYALPYKDEYSTILDDAHFQQHQGLGVPGLYDREVWGSNYGSPSYEQWRQMAG